MADHTFTTLYVVSLFGVEERTLQYRFTSGTRVVLDDPNLSNFTGSERFDTADLPMMAGVVKGAMAIGTSYADARRCLIEYWEKDVDARVAGLTEAQKMLKRARGEEVP